MKSRLPVIILICASLLGLAVLGMVGCGGSPNSGSITGSSPPWAKLAVIQSGSPRPPADILGRFEHAFKRLEAHCPDTPEQIGDFIVTSQRQLSERGKPTSLLELTEGVAAMLDTAADAGGIPKMNSCAEPVALFVTARLAQ